MLRIGLGENQKRGGRMKDYKYLLTYLTMLLNLFFVITFYILNNLCGIIMFGIASIGYAIWLLIETLLNSNSPQCPMVCVPKKEGGSTPWVHNQPHRSGEMEQLDADGSSAIKSKRGWGRSYGY